MSKYMYLFRGGDHEMAAMSNEEKQAHMQTWTTWMKGLAEKGTLVDGLPLNKAGKRVTDKGTMVHDGPFSEGKEVVGGYLIVNAADINEAVEISKGCPIFENNGEVEVREVMSMDM